MDPIWCRFRSDSSLCSGPSTAFYSRSLSDGERRRCSDRLDSPACCFFVGQFPVKKLNRIDLEPQTSSIETPKLKKPYHKPSFGFESVFETTALSCGKFDDAGGVSHEQEEFMSLDDHNRVAAAHTRKCELVDEVLRSFGTVHLKVTGCSMLPSVWPGDTLIIQRRDVQEIAVGDILLYCRKGSLVAHRVVSESDSLGRSRVGVRGDAFPGQDELLCRSEILGTVSRIVRGKKSMLPPARLKYRHRLIGILTWHSDSFARLVIFVHSICSAARWREVSWKR